MEIPAFTRRTFDWLRVSLLKGMSREDARVIFFWAAFAMVFHSATGAESHSLEPPNPSRGEAPPSDSQEGGVE
ncbi:hypothetical protein GCM10011324_43520 [Allosediminivita pacifica]|nr:hypothetical protein GCM10011324_43520 [Allosediminivita pacifica]